jgi:4-amino-4-deoxy-L-arabinose transferase-like glycosyltransferase
MWGAAAIAAGTVLRAVFLVHHPRFAGDALLYGDLAHNMVAHHIYGFTESPAIRPTLIRLPGYPIFLAVCFALFGAGNYTSALWVQAGFDLAGCAMLGVLASRLAGRRAGLATIWLAALCPFTANYCAVALTEILCLFGSVVALFAMERWVVAFRGDGRGWGWACLVGLGLILGVMMRPDQGLVAAALVPVMLWVGLRSRSVRFGMRVMPAVLASLMIAVPLSLWAARNWHVYHVFQPLAPRYANDPGEANPYGFQRWYRTWAVEFKSTFDVYWVYDGGPVDMKDLPRRAFDSAAQRQETAKIYAQYNEVTQSTPAIDSEFGALAAERVRGSRFRYYVELPVLKELDMWLRPRTELLKMPLDFWNVRAHPWWSVAEFVYAGLDAGYFLLGVVGLCLWQRRGWSGMPALGRGIVAFVVMRCALLLTIDNSEPRYTLECFPVVFLMAGMAVGWWRTKPLVDEADPLRG